MKRWFSALAAALVLLCLVGCASPVPGEESSGPVQSAAAHQLPGSPVPQNGVDGINQNGFACAGFAGQHIKAGGEGYFGLFNHGDIFNF